MSTPFVLKNCLCGLILFSSLSHARDVDPSPDLIEVGPILTWEFIGQAEYQQEAYRSPIVEYTIEDLPAEDPVGQLLGTVRVDSDGKMWRVISVDQDALRESILAENLRAGWLQGEDPLAAIQGAPDPHAGERVTIEYQSWNVVNCGANAVRLWDGESRLQVTGALNTQEAAIVRLTMSDPVLSGTCTGTIIRDRWVLTAAHCVTDPADGTPINPQNVSVDRLDTAETILGFQIFPAPDWTYSGHTKDYALLKMKTSWSAGFDDMNLAAASDATIEALTSPKSLQLPGAVGAGCTSAGGALFLNNADDIGFVGGTFLNLNMDGGSGASGSPAYFCPAGNDNICLASDAGNVLGVWSGWISWPVSTHRAPKVPAFRTWALGIMNNN